MMRNFIHFLAALALARAPLQAQIPVITNQPISQVVWAGANVTFAVGVSGSGPLTYQWQFNKTNLPASNIRSVAGGGIDDNRAATNANVYPVGLAVDAFGNIFIADGQNDRIRKLSTNGVITTVAGNGADAYSGVAAVHPENGFVPKLGGTGVTYSGDGGPATNASLYYPAGVAVDTRGNLFIADQNNNRIRKVDTNGIITTVAGNGTGAYAGDGSAATNASLWSPAGVAVDAVGDLFIADLDNNVIRKVDSNGLITTVAGTNIAGFFGDGGPATNAELNGPHGVAVDTRGELFIADSGNQCIRKVDTNGIITTFAGNNTYGFGGDGGPATNAMLWGPLGVTLDGSGNVLIADTQNSRIREVGGNGVITTVAGTNIAGFFGDGGTATNAGLFDPFGATVDNHGNLLIADSYNYRVRKVGPNAIITTLAGNGTSDFSGDGGPANLAAISDIPDVAVDTHGNLFIDDAGNQRIRKVDTNGIITTYAGNGAYAYSGDNGEATNAAFSDPYGVAVDAQDNLFIADLENNRVRKVSASGIITTVAGNGTAAYAGDGGKSTNASLSGPSGVAVDSAGNVYIADASNQRIRMAGADGIITTVAGNGAPGPYLIGTYSGDGSAATNAGLSNPAGVAVDTAGNLFIADAFNYRIRKVDANGVITTYAGNGVRAYAGDGGAATNASIGLAYGVAVDSSGNLFIADGSNSRIREVGTNGIISTVAGNGTAAYVGDGGAATNGSLSQPGGVAVDSLGNIFVADTGNRHIRKVTSPTAGPIFELTDVTGENAGDYQVAVNGTNGSVTSEVATLNVTTSPLIYETIHNPDESMSFSFVSPPGSTNVVLVTTNLVPPVVWTSLSTNVAAVSGDWQFTDTSAGHYRTRFYRSLDSSTP